MGKICADNPGKNISWSGGHEFRATLYRHLKDPGIGHARIKPRTPRQNGRKECSHGMDMMK